jgi:hypothetical protein
MSTIVTRAGKGSPLTHTEVDNNFTNLNTDKVESSGGTLTNPTINGTVATTGLNFDSNTLVIDATNNNVGIGTSSPSDKLSINAGNNSSSDLNALTLINDGENGTNINFNNTFGALAQIKGTKLGSGASANEGVLAFSTAFNTSLTERMRIDSSGNVGIGTNSPSSKLDVDGNVIAVGTKTASAGLGGNIRFRDDTGTTRWLNGILGGSGAVNYDIYDVANSAARLTIDPSGNVGIGTSSPATKLDVSGTVTATAFVGDGSGLTGVSAGVPAGTIIYHAANTAPTGFIKANGAAVSRTTYSALFSAIGTTFGAGDGSTTFNVPDLRGEFPRGWDDSRGVDSGRAFGSSQTDAMQGHRHNRNTLGNPERVLDDAGTGWSDPGGGSLAELKIYTVTGDPLTDGTNGTPRTAAETRPRNIALLACIKF